MHISGKSVSETLRRFADSKQQFLTIDEGWSAFLAYSAIAEARMSAASDGWKTSRKQLSSLTRASWSRSQQRWMIRGSPGSLSSNDAKTSWKRSHILLLTVDSRCHES